MVYVVMGVSGCGKSTIAKFLAEAMALPFFDGDDFHPQANIDKMASGKSLNDADREPWLQELASQIQLWNQSTGAVLACSALKQSYRDILQNPISHSNTSEGQEGSQTNDTKSATHPVGSCEASSRGQRAPRELNINEIIFIHLTGSKELITQRMKARDHFMPPALLDSQFTTLEAPTDSWDYAIDLDPETIITQIQERIHAYAH